MRNKSVLLAKTKIAVFHYRITEELHQRIAVRQCESRAEAAMLAARFATYEGTRERSGCDAHVSAGVIA